MAGITSTTVVPVKLKASHFFSNKLSIPHSLNLQSSPSFTLPSHATVRYGVNLRPSAYGGGGNFRRAPPEKDADDGQALDLSTLRYVF